MQHISLCIFLIIGILSGAFSWLFVSEDTHKAPTVAGHCPDEGNAHHGEWRLDNKDGYRCILKCHYRYSPNGCNVIRKDGYGHWNFNKPTCEEESWLLNKRNACISAIGTAILLSPTLLYAFGFATPGIVANSLAAKYMAYMGTVSKGSWFSYLQSLGMKGGLSKGTLASLSAAVGGACDRLTSFFSDTACERRNNLLQKLLSDIIV